MPASHAIKAFRSLAVKDLVSELRARRAWPGMLLLGLILVLLLEMQLDLPAGQKAQVVSGLLWLDVFFAGLLALERSFASEREEDCWRALRLYPVPPVVIYLAKVAVNVVALGLLEGVLIPAVVIFSDAPLLEWPAALAMIAVLGNLGFASIGVVVSALTASLSQRGGLLALVLLPLVTPVLLGASEATRLLVVGGQDERWWRWVELLAAFAVLFMTLGMLVFEFAIED
jgi:heme exporter protein B